MDKQNNQSIRFLQIEPTTRCNFSCDFCCGRKMKQHDLSIELLEKILEDFPSLQHVEFQGEGEPLLLKDFALMVERIRDRNIKVSFITNGSLLNETMSRHLLRLGVEKIYISMESADSAQFAEIRGGSLAKIKENLSSLLRIRDAMQLVRPLVGLSVTVLKSTVDQFPSLIEWYQKMGLDGGISTQFLSVMDDYTSAYSQSSLNEILDEDDKKKFNVIAQQYNQICSEGQGVGFYDELYQDWRPQFLSCPWLEQGFYINCRGEITGCCRIKNCEAYSFGSIAKQKTTLNNELWQRMREHLRQGGVPPVCQGCRIANLISVAHAGAQVPQQNFTRQAVAKLEDVESGLELV